MGTKDNDGTVQRASLIVVKRGLVIPSRVVLFTTDKGIVTKQYGYVEIESFLREPRIINGKVVCKDYSRG